MNPDLAEILGILGADIDRRVQIAAVIKPGLRRRAIYRLGGTGRGEPDVLYADLGPAGAAAVRRVCSGLGDCVAAYEAAGAGPGLFLQAGDRNMLVPVRNGYERRLVAAAVRSGGFGRLPAAEALREAMDTVGPAGAGFVNRGLFSARHAGLLPEGAGAPPGGTAWDALRSLGWDAAPGAANRFPTDAGEVLVAVCEGGMDEQAAPAPEGAAWVVLTDGRRWRLYGEGRRTGAHLEIDAKAGGAGSACLAAVFGAPSYSATAATTTTPIEAALAEAGRDASDLAGGIASNVRCSNILADLAGWLLGGGGERRHSHADLDGAAGEALALIHQVMFVLFAEARGLLPAHDRRYAPISMGRLYSRLDFLARDPDGTGCWDHLARIFAAVRDGSAAHGVPEHGGDLFEANRTANGRPPKNRLASRVLRALLEVDGMPTDYSVLGIRQLGDMYESLAEITVHQAERHTPVLEGRDGERRVAGAGEKPTASYDDGDIYAVTRRRISRKSSGTYYTPQPLVRFLVGSALEPVLAERAGAAAGTERSGADALLDIRVLDPAMGSGHFLTEALSQIVAWAEGVLDRDPDHPLGADLERERAAVPAGTGAGVAGAGPDRPTRRDLLRRRVLRRCIFGVDINPLAVDLAKASLWLDSMTAGMPLADLDRHLKEGDSTVGMWLSDLDAGATTLDRWTPGSGGDPRRAPLDALAAGRMGVDPAGMAGSGIRPFHWELEIPDAFAGRRGFDAIVGNPPWNAVRQEPVEFLQMRHPEHRQVGRRKDQHALRDALSDPELRRGYGAYCEAFARRIMFYRGCRLQGYFKDMYGVMLERALDLVAEGGVIAMAVPAQLLNTINNTSLRRELFGMEIRSIHVFENIRGLFPIDPRYRFALLVVRKGSGPDEFPAGFYLHDPRSLEDRGREAGKFTTLSKRYLRSLFPDALHIPEVPEGRYWDILAAIHGAGTPLGDGRNGWSMASRNAHYDMLGKADISGGPGLIPIISGRNIQQFVHDFVLPGAGVDAADAGRIARRNDWGNVGVRNGMYRLLYRDVTGSTNIRTVIAAITPPGSVFDTSLRHLVLSRDGRFEFSGDEEARYNAELAYLAGVLNSMTFDFVARSLVNTHLSGVMKSLPVPRPGRRDRRIAEMAAALSVDGSARFGRFAGSMGLENARLEGTERVEVAAALDVEVAAAYGLGAERYGTVVGSFSPERARSWLVGRAARKASVELRAYLAEVREAALRMAGP